MASANLFQQYLQPVRSMAEYAADMDKREASQLDLTGKRRQNEIAALTADQTRQTMAQAAGDRNALQKLAATWGADTTLDQRVASLRNSGRPALMTQADALEKQGLEKQKIGAEVGEKGSKVLDEAIKRYRGALDFIDTPDGAVRWLKAQYEDPTTGQFMARFGPFEQTVTRIPSDPAAFQQWRQQAAMGIDKFMEEQRQRETQAEVARHNLSTEKTAAGQLAVSQGQLGVARGNLTARQKELEYQQSQPKGQIVQTDQGVMLVDPRSGNAIPTFGPDGKPLTKQMKDIPAAINTAMLTNSQNMNKVQQAINLLDGVDVGALKGDKAATGWKGYAPQAALNRLDPKGVDARAMIADIGSLIIHDRSGAAVTAAESPRLMPFIPLVTDDRETARKKLVRFKQLYQQEQQAMQDVYSKEQGYRAPPNASAVPDDIQSILNKHGVK